MANPLALADKPHKMTAQDWADRGNRILDGKEPRTKDGSYMFRDDVRWVVRDGRCVIVEIQ